VSSHQCSEAAHFRGAVSWALEQLVATDEGLPLDFQDGGLIAAGVTIAV